MRGCVDRIYCYIYPPAAVNTDRMHNRTLQHRYFVRRTRREVQRARQRHRGVAYDTHPIPTVTSTTVVVAAVVGVVVVAGVNIAVVVDGTTTAAAAAAAAATTAVVIAG